MNQNEELGNEAPTGPLPCPFCGSHPRVSPLEPLMEGSAWASVECTNRNCPARAQIRDGVGVADNRGSDAYKRAAIKRWNTRALPSSSPSVTSVEAKAEERSANAGTPTPQDQVTKETGNAIRPMIFDPEHYPEDRQPAVREDRYVVGLMFDSITQSRVALIRKNKPKWQAGKLNGIGGKLEHGENIFDCMVREFEEETGWQTTVKQWDRYLTMAGGNDDGALFRVDFFVTVGNLKELRSVEAEQVEQILLNSIWPGRPDMIENLPWLIGLALDYLQDGRPEFVTAHYPLPVSLEGQGQTASHSAPKGEQIVPASDIGMVIVEKLIDDGYVINAAKNGLTPEILKVAVAHIINSSLPCFHQKERLRAVFPNN